MSSPTQAKLQKSINTSSKMQTANCNILQSQSVKYLQGGRTCISLAYGRIGGAYESNRVTVGQSYIVTDGITG
jgi:hypothetical protein